MVENRLSYQEKLKELQETLCSGVDEIFNGIVKRYGYWYKYPRKIKKNLKKRLLWEFIKIVNKREIPVVIKSIPKESEIFDTDKPIVIDDVVFDDAKMDTLREELSEVLKIPKEYFGRLRWMKLELL